MRPRVDLPKRNFEKPDFAAFLKHIEPVTPKMMVFSIRAEALIQDRPDIGDAFYP